jgi:cell division septal protein FtsQ
MHVFKGLGWTFAVLTSLIAAASVYLAMNPHWIKIETVQLDLAPTSKEALLYQRIRSTLLPQYQHFAGRFFWEVPLSSIYDLTLKDKRVHKVSVYREFPSRLRVEIEPQTPVLAYLSNDNRIYPIAADATLLPAQLLSEVSDLPILRGEELRDEQALRESALELFDQIPNEGPLKKKTVSEILYTRKDGFKIFMNGIASEIKMGDADFGPKVSRIERVLAYLDSQNIKGRVIDARFSKKVVVRVRKGP